MHPRPRTTHSFDSSGLLRRGAAVLAVGLCVSATVAIWALLTGSFDETSVRVLLSALAASLCTFNGLAGSSLLAHTGSRRTLGQATIAASAVALSLTLAAIWIPQVDEAQTPLRALGVAISVMFAGGHASLMLARLRRPESPLVLAFTRIAVGSASAAALLLSGLLIFATGPVAPTVWRVFGILVVLAQLNTLLAPLARRIARRGEKARDDGSSAPDGERPRAARERGTSSLIVGLGATR